MIESSVAFGLFTRLLGLLFAFQCATTVGQLLPLIGSRGVEPICFRYRLLRREQGLLRGFLKYPSLFWLSQSDWAIVAIQWVGAACGLLIFSGIGGDANPLLCIVCWMILFSTISSGPTPLRPFPWDLLFLECLLLSVFLPGSAGMLEIGLVDEPGLLVHIGFILLAFRMMFGMGLAKFWWGRSDPANRDGTYIFHMLGWQPMGTAHAAWMRLMPMVVHRMLLRGLFVVELILPWLAFAGVWGRAVFAFSMVLLQIGIAIAGNYGTFNVLTAMLALPLLSKMPELSMPVFDIESVLLLILLLLPLPVFPFLTSWNNDIWCSSWSEQALGGFPQKYQRFLAPFYRWITPYRLFSGYGVFVGTPSLVKELTVIQMSQDGNFWFDVVPKRQTGKPEKRPGLFAPFHPRWDHFIYYYKSYRNSIPLEVLFFSPWSVREISDIGFVDKLIEHLYRGNDVVESIFAELPYKSPAFIRLAVMRYRLNTPQERRKTGNYWSKSLLAASDVYERIELDEVDALAGVGQARRGRFMWRSGVACVQLSPEEDPIPIYRHPVSKEMAMRDFTRLFSAIH